MSTDAEALRWRIQALEKGLTRINDLIPELEARLNWLEHPPAQVVENTEAPDPVTCPDCHGKNTESKLGTGVFSDSVAHRCKNCDHSWRVDIKDENLPDGIAEKRAAAVAKAKADARFREVGLDPVAIDASRAADDRREDARLRELEVKCPGSVMGLPLVYRIVYRTAAGAKPTFIHVRADSESRALIAFIDETSPLQVSAVQLDSKYDGPLLNERENFWPANERSAK